MGQASPFDLVSRRHPDWLLPPWQRRDCGDRLGALMTTRSGGTSSGPYASLNLGAATGDDPARVVDNREVLRAVMAATPVFLEQVHGVEVARLDAAHGDSLDPIRADASVTTEPGIACTVLAADCLPVLFAAPDGRAVGAAHAGWRGLSAGVVEKTLAAVCDAAGCEPVDVRAWLGACIGPSSFEVGADVLDAFGVGPDEPARAASAAGPAGLFVPRPGIAGKWLADLAGLARLRLEVAGVSDISGGSWCTVGDASRFYSYRRDGRCGRMAACIWIEDAGRD